MGGRDKSSQLVSRTTGARDVRVAAYSPRTANFVRVVAQDHADGPILTFRYEQGQSRRSSGTAANGKRHPENVYGHATVISVQWRGRHFDASGTLTPAPITTGIIVSFDPHSFRGTGVAPLEQVRKVGERRPMDTLLQKELVEAGLRLREAIARVVNEAPECFTQKNGKWSVEFRNPLSGESMSVTYSACKLIANPAQVN